MVASLSLVGCCIEEQILGGFKPKALCIGVGGGALLGFLRAQLGFEVVGIEADKEVLRVVRRYFGLLGNESIRVIVGDAIDVIEKFIYHSNGVHEGENGSYLNDGSDENIKFDAIKVDLDSSDATNGTSAPPLEFIRKQVLLATKSVLCDFGIHAINVISPNRSFYEKLIYEFCEVFHELYEIDVGNGENFVVVATMSPTISSISDSEDSFVTRLRMAISGAYMDSIRKI